MPDKLPLNRRHVLQASLGAAAWAATAHTTALAAGSAPPVPDLAKVTLRIGTYKGLWRALLAASGQGQAGKQQYENGQLPKGSHAVRLAEALDTRLRKRRA